MHNRTIEDDGKRRHFSHEAHFFLRDEDGTPIGVCAIGVEAIDTVTADVRIGASWCSPKDHWDRDLGKTIAYGRMAASNPIHIDETCETEFEVFGPNRKMDEKRARHALGLVCSRLTGLEIVGCVAVRGV